MAAKIGALIGFTNIGEVNNHLNDFQRSLKEDNPVTPLATSMLVIMIRGLFSNISFPYAQFPCTELSGYHLYNIFWEAVGRLKLCGFRVMGLIVTACLQIDAFSKYPLLRQPAYHTKF